MEENVEKEPLTIKDKMNIRAKQVLNAPKEAEENIQLVKDRLILNIQSKEYLEDLLYEEMSKEEFALIMARDKELRETVQKVTEGMINPDPVSSIKAERSPVAFDLTHGISVFWDGMKAPIEQKVDVAVEAKKIADHVEEGMDINKSPSARKEILNDLGIADKDLIQLVTPADEAYYQKEVVDHYRNEHMERLGLKDKDMLDAAEEELLNNLVEDSLAMPEGFRIEVVREDKANEKLIDPYVEEFGMTGEQLNKSFGYADEVTQYDYPPFEELHRVEEYPTMQFAIEEYGRVYGGSLEDNMNELDEIERVQSIAQTSQLNTGDLDDLGSHIPYQDHFDDLELSEDDLFNLEEWDSLEY